MGEDEPNPQLEPLKLLLQMSQQTYSKKSKSKALKLMKMVAVDGRKIVHPQVYRFLDIIVETTKHRKTGSAIKMIGRYAQSAIEQTPYEPTSTATPMRNSNVSM